MKTIVFVFLLFSLLGCTSPEKELSNNFYCFSNAGNLPGTPDGLDAKVRFFKDLGFEGWGGHYGEEDYPARRAALTRAGMLMPEIYWNLDVDSAGNWSSKEGIREAIVDSKDRNLIVSLIVRAPAFQDNQSAGDPLVVEAVRELADFAAPYGVRIAVYPHIDVYCETSGHSVRLAKMAGRDNVGAIFNLCHFLKKEGEEAWEQKLTEALPYLYMISISGADSGNTQEMGWDRLIQSLGDGSFDTYPLVKLARDMGYEGPFGLQTYNIKQDAEVTLSKSINTWQEYQLRYKKEQAGASVKPAKAKECPSEFTDLFDGESYVQSVAQWQQDRLEGLKSKNGWLNLAGIYWLKEGSQSFGSDPSSDLVFPAKAPAFIGTLTLEGESVLLEVKEGVELYFEGKEIQDLELSYDKSGKPSYVTHGDFAWYIMKRHKSLALRLRDYKNPAIEALDHIPSYPISTDYVVEARLKPFDVPKTITVNTPFQDYTQEYSCPGELHFKLKGEKLTLLPFESGDNYFIIFSDETSALETYGGGRFMYTSPDSTGSILLDFNKAYNPPCALTPFAACPMPPQENHLPVKVEAGEKVVAKH